METNNLVVIDEFCETNDIEVSFIKSLHKYGLIGITSIDGTDFFDDEQLQKIDRYLRFYYELNIGHGGMDSIRHLFFHVNAMCEKINRLRNQTCLDEHIIFTN